jgi:hypothetical protein
MLQLAGIAFEIFSAQNVSLNGKVLLSSREAIVRHAVNISNLCQSYNQFQEVLSYAQERLIWYL